MSAFSVEHQAKTLATRAHEGQKYGLGEPYTVHLEDVRNILVEFGFSGEEDNDYLVGAWLHDVLEDTETTQEFLQQTFGTHAIAMVWAVTGRGKNRRERNEDAYKKIIAYPDAIPLKLADRLSNGRNSKRDKLDLYDMYRDEYPNFRARLKPATKPDFRTTDMWNALDKLFHFFEITFP